MIEIPKSKQYLHEKSFQAYLGRPIYDLQKDIFRFPSKRPKYKFYPPRTLTFDGNVFLSVCEAKNNVFLTSFNNSTFKYIDDEVIEFKINTKAHTAKFINKQVFLASETHMYSYHDHHFQSMAIKNISMDTMELTNEVIFLQEDRIKFLEGPEHKLTCNDPCGIHFTDHPRNVLLTTTQAIYHIDLRTEKPVFILDCGSKILDLKKTKDNYIARFHIGFTVFDKELRYNEFSSLYFDNRFRLTANDTEIIGYSSRVFKYFDINNLSVNSTMQHYVADFIGFATQNDRHYFFRDNCIDEFDSKQKVRSIGCKLKDEYPRRLTTTFFDNDFSEDRRCKEYEISKDLNVDKYDEFMELVKNENEDAPIAVVEKKVEKKRVKRAAGF